MRNATDLSRPVCHPYLYFILFYSSPPDGKLHFSCGLPHSFSVFVFIFSQGRCRAECNRFILSPKWSVLVSVPDVHIFLFDPVIKNKAETDVREAIFRVSLICWVVLHCVAQTPVVSLVIDWKKRPRQWGRRATNHYSGADHYKWPLPPVTVVGRQGHEGTYKNVSYQLRRRLLPAHLIRGLGDGLTGSIMSIKDRVGQEAWGCIPL